MTKHISHTCGRRSCWPVRYLSSSTHSHSSERYLATALWVSSSITTGHYVLNKKTWIQSVWVPKTMPWRNRSSVANFPWSRNGTMRVVLHTVVDLVGDGRKKTQPNKTQLGDEGLSAGSTPPTVVNIWKKEKVFAFDKKYTARYLGYQLLLMLYSSSNNKVNTPVHETTASSTPSINSGGGGDER